MNVGDTVRVLYPTGGVLLSHRFKVVDLPHDPNGWVVIKGDIGGTHGVRVLRFHKSSLEVVDDQGESQSVDVSAVHPATAKRERVRHDLENRINEYAHAVRLLALGRADRDYVQRKEAEMRQAIPLLQDACYAEIDDGHGLGKDGLDAAREVVEDAVWYPLNRMSAGDRKDDAWLVGEEKMRALANAIGMKGEI